MSTHQVIDNDCVNISNQDAAEIGRLLRLLTPSENTVSGLIKSVRLLEQGTTRKTHSDYRSLMSAARQIYAVRRARSRYFPEGFFGEPAWDMLLALYATGDDSRRQSVSNLVDLASCPPTTALRHLTSLEQEGMVERTPHPTDGRVFFISLTAKGRGAIEAYLVSIMEL